MSPAYRQTSFYIPNAILIRESELEILKNLCLTWTGLYVEAQGHLVNHRTLSDWVLIYCARGQGWLQLGGKRWVIRKGDVFFCPPGVPHTYGADSQDPWTKYWVHFRGTSAPTYLALLKLTPENPLFSLGHDASLITRFHEIFEVLETGFSQANLLLSSALLGALLASLNQRLANPRGNATHELVMRQVIDYMRNNLHSPLNLEDLASQARLSRFHFARCFKQVTGSPPLEYFHRLKIQKACTMLQLAPTKISDLSDELGFRSPQYFAMTFKRLVGKTPSEFRG